MKAILSIMLIIALAACSPASAPAPGAEVAPTTGALELRDAWAAPTPGGVDVSAGYLTITNGTATEDRLMAASSPRASRVEVHEMNMDGGVMRMRPVEALAIPAGGDATLAPGGQHLMFYGVTHPFTPGENIPVHLTFEHAGEMDVDLPVRAAH